MLMSQWFLRLKMLLQWLPQWLPLRLKILFLKEKQDIGGLILPVDIAADSHLLIMVVHIIDVPMLTTIVLGVLPQEGLMVLQEDGVIVPN